MHYNERATLIAALKPVDEVMELIDEDGTFCKTLERIKKLYPFNKIICTKGGDRYASEIPESATCRKCNIQIIDGLGAKIQSSSDLVKRAEKLK